MNVLPEYCNNLILTLRTAVAEKKRHWSNNNRILFILLTMCLKVIKYVMLWCLYFSVAINYFPGAHGSLIANITLTLRSAIAEKKKKKTLVK